MKKPKTENIRPAQNDIVRFKDMGNIKEIMYSQKANHNISIKRLDKSYYVDLKTGEVKEFNHLNSRADDKNSVRVSLCKLRDLINANVENPNNCLWCTLTYSENMTDTKRLYQDFRKFIQRLRYNLKKQQFEYIVAMEPQGRGAWHAHLILIFPHKAPFIPNKTLAEIWGNGFVKVQKLTDIDNIGAYLTAYLGDMDLEEIKKNNISIKNSHTLKEIDTVDENGNPIKKRIIKGARLSLYPPKFNLYRCSKGIKKPDISYMKNSEAEKKVGSVQPTFEKTVAISEGDFSNLFNYRQYNIKRNNNQDNN